MLKVAKQNHIHKMSAANKPCASVKSGTRFVVETWDALEGMAKEYYDRQTPYPDIFPNANPATGPIYVEGVQPGDLLEVEIHDIRLQDEGYIVLPGSFLSGGGRNEDVYAEVKVKDSMLLYNGMMLPANPMIGVIGTAPLEGMWCQETGDHGGNMDCSIIGAGSKVLLPVYTEGALLSIGDAHAAMGDGEVFCQGVEIGAEIELTVKRVENCRVVRPVVINSGLIACIASDRDINAARENAVSGMVHYLTAVLGLCPKNACILIATYGNLRFCQVVNPQKTVRMEIDAEYIRQGMAAD